MKESAISEDQPRKSVYVFVAQELVKVGISRDPDLRFATLRSFYPDLLSVAFASEQLLLPHRVEREIHQALAPYVSVRGKEWFRCAASVAIEIAEGYIKEHVRKTKLYAVYSSPKPCEELSMAAKPVLRLIPGSIQAPEVIEDYKPPSLTLDLEEAAAILKCHPDSLRHLVKHGDVPGTKVGRAWVFVESQLMEWLEERCRRK
jgi:excisionase family DNA binding protein